MTMVDHKTRIERSQHAPVQQNTICGCTNWLLRIPVMLTNQSSNVTN